MSKTKLCFVFLLLFLSSYSPSFALSDYQQTIENNCLKPYGWDYDKYTKDAVWQEDDGNPVVYYQDFAKILQCVEANFDYDPRHGNATWINYQVPQIAELMGIEEFNLCAARKEGDTCRSAHEACQASCNAKYPYRVNVPQKNADCNNNCGAVRYACSQDFINACQNEFIAALPAYARSLQKNQRQDNIDDDLEKELRDRVNDDPNDPKYQFCLPPKEAYIPDNEFQIIKPAYAQIFANYSVVTYIKGQVQVKTKDAPRWAPAFKGLRLTIGDCIKTGKNGYSEIKFANSAIFRQRPLSKLCIPDHKDNCRVSNIGYLDLKFKKVWSKVRPDPDIEMCIPTACTGRRDTQAGTHPNTGSLPYEIVPIAQFLNPDYKLSNLFTTDSFLNLNQVYAKSEDTHVYSFYDEETKIGKFFVESGEHMAVYDQEETSIIPLSAGEHIELNDNEIPTQDKIIPASQITNPWWDSTPDYSNLIPFAFGGLAFIVLFIIVKKFKHLKNLKLKLPTKKPNLKVKTEQKLEDIKQKTSEIKSKKTDKKQIKKTKFRFNKKPIKLILLVIGGILLLLSLNQAINFAKSKITQLTTKVNQNITSDTSSPTQEPTPPIDSDIQTTPTNSDNTPDTSQTKRYYNCIYNYSFDYPADFNISDETHISDAVYVYGHGINVSFTAFDNDGSDVNSFVDNRQTEIDGTLVDHQTSLDSGQPVEFLTFENPTSLLVAWPENFSFIELFFSGDDFNLENPYATVIADSLEFSVTPSECGKSQNQTQIDPQTCLHPNGDIEFWWDTATQAEKDCFRAKYPDSPFLNQ